MAPLEVGQPADRERPRGHGGHLRFDRPDEVEAALALDYDGDQVTAAVSAAPAFPAVLRTLAESIPRHHATTIVDLGAGLGGASTWLARETGARLIAVEPSNGARAAAKQLFPDLDIRSGTAQHSGLNSAIADAIVLLGVTSLIDDLHEVLAEVRRLLRRGGVVGIADIFVDGDAVEYTGVNVLRSLPRLTSELSADGFEVIAVGCAKDATAGESWAVLSSELKHRVLHDHAGEPAIEAWLADQQQISAWIDSQHVYGACVVARPKP